eukprot:TRINITY_DN33156_c0_g1_i1.p1 TRINITY_DN33156_c0_g1~~TRINITY_DN33156_c0_g1_i1.p1  ORF type:complete len:352 (+),score=106.56 TRINITY_DN33156_c0_g1_i1:77-1132(+)
MRKISVRCAAANDDEDDDAEDVGSAFAERVPKRPRINQLSDGGSAASSEKKQPVKKKKEFAWMESDDEDDGEPSGEKVSEKVSEKSVAAASSKKKEFAWMESDDEDDAAEPSGEKTRDDADETEATLEHLDAVQSFGRMMLLTDSLHEKLKSRALGAEELAAACRALGRTKFFDGELLESLSSTLRAMILSDKLSAGQITDVFTCFFELNYYKKDIFSAVAKVFKAEGHQAALNPVDRATWLEVMQRLGHETDLEFMQMLEVPPLPATNPSYRRIRCIFFARGSCAAGDSCTYAHSDKAPLSLELGVNSSEDAWRKRSVIMTHCQKYVFKEKDVMLGGLLAQKRKDAAAGL